MGNFWRTDYSLQEFLFIIYTREYQITSKYNIDKIKINEMIPLQFWIDPFCKGE